MGHTQTSQPGTSFSDSRLQEIRQQVDRICASPPFSTSQRYPALLRYVVEQTLAGHCEQLKERIIGVEAFHRSADYDSNADPAVRIAATEVRKRLAQYYYQPGREQELRIELPVGSYVPSFRFPEDTAVGSGPPRGQPLPVSPGRKHVAWWGAGILGLSLLLLSSYVLLEPPVKSSTTLPTSASTSSGFDLFWSQFVQANGSVQLCIGLWPEESWRPVGPGFTAGMSDYEGVRKIASLLESRKKRVLNRLTLVGPQASELSGFLDGPIVYLGPHEAIASKMARWRFSLDKQIPAHRLWVRDRESTYDKRWHTELLTLQQRSEGYAIVTLIHEGELSRPLLFVNGSDSDARTGAVELLTDPTNSEALFGDAPNWRGMNFQAVIETRTGNDNQVSAKVLVKHFWK